MVILNPVKLTIKTTYHRSSWKPTGHTSQGNKVVLTLFPFLEFQFSNLILSFVEDHLLGPLLPPCPHSEGTKHIFSYNLPSSPHPFVWPINTRGILPGNPLATLERESGRWSSVFFLSSNSNSPISSYPCSRPPAGACLLSLLPFLGDSTDPWGRPSFPLSCGSSHPSSFQPIPISSCQLSTPRNKFWEFLVSPPGRDTEALWIRQPTATTRSKDPVKVTETKEWKTHPIKTRPRITIILNSDA